MADTIIELEKENDEYRIYYTDVTSCPTCDSAELYYTQKLTDKSRILKCAKCGRAWILHHDNYLSDLLPETYDENGERVKIKQVGEIEIIEREDQ